MALFVFGSFWGATLPLTKVAVSGGLAPIGLIFWQLVFTACFLGVVVLGRRLRVLLAPRHLVFYVVIGLIGTIIPNSFSYLAARQLPAGIYALAIASVPMISLLLALALGNERFALRRVGGIALGVAAMMLIALPDASLPQTGMSLWLLVAMVAPLCYAVEGNYFARFAPRDLSPIPALFGASFVGAIIAAPMAYFSGNWVDMFLTWDGPRFALLGSAFGHAVAYCGYMWLVARAGIVFTTQIAYVVTGMAISFSIVFLGESYSLWVWGAVALMLLGLSLVRPVERADI